MTNKERVAEIGSRLTAFRASPPNGEIDYAVEAGKLLSDMPYLLARIANYERLEKAVRVEHGGHQYGCGVCEALAKCEEEDAV